MVVPNGHGVCTRTRLLVVSECVEAYCVGVVPQFDSSISRASSQPRPARVEHSTRQPVTVTITTQQKLTTEPKILEVMPSTE